MAKLNLSYTVITAPYDGVMGRRAISDGQLVQAGQQIATIVLNGQKWVTANFLEGQMPKIAIGKKIMMSADALGGQQFEGRLQLSQQLQDPDIPVYLQITLLVTLSKFSREFR